MKQPAGRVAFSQLLGPRFLLQELAASVQPPQANCSLAKVLELLLCLTCEAGAPEAAELSEALQAGDSCLRLLAELLPRPEVPESAKEKFVLLFQLLLRR